MQGDAPEEQSEKEKREEEQPEEQSENGKQEEAQPEEQSENGKREEEKREEEKRLSVLYERYPSLQDRPLRESKAFQKNPVIVDRYMYSWMNILIAGRTGIHFWNRRAVKKSLISSSIFLFRTGKWKDKRKAERMRFRLCDRKR